MPRTILVADRSALARSLVGATLRAAGYRVVAAATLADALALLAALRVDLVVSGTTFPDAPTGAGDWAAVARLRAATGTIPLVLHGARAGTPLARPGSPDVAAVVPKGSDTQALLAVVRVLLRG